MSNIGTSKGGQRSYNFSGYALFVEEQKNTNPRKKMSLQAAGASLRESWNKLEEHERLEYKSRANELRGPAKGKKYIVPFYTRYAPKQFIDVCKVLKGRPKTMERLKVIGFDKLVRISCSHIQRDLCGAFMRAFDPPTKTISIRGKTWEMEATNVNEIMGLPVHGSEIMATTCDEEKFKEMKMVYGKVPYTTIDCWLVDEKEHADLEFLFVMYSVGILLDPSACIYVSDKVLKVMALTKDAYTEFDWCTFVVNKLADSVKDYLEEFRKGDAGGRKNIGGCLYFLMIYCLQMFPLGRQKASEVGDAISYWNDEQVQARTRLEKESKQGVLHGSTSKDRPEASTFNPDVDLTHPLIKASYDRIMTMVGKELLALQYRLLGEAEGGHVNEAADHYQEEGADEGIQRDDKDGGESEEEGNGSGDEGADGSRDERGEEGGDEGNEQVGEIHVRRSKREKKPAVRSPYFVETKARVAKKRKTVDDKEALFNVCTGPCAGCEEQEIYVEMNGFHVTRGELGCLRTRAWMSTTVMTMVAKTLVQDEKDRTRSVRRHIFSAHFMHKMLVNPMRWSIEGNESEILPQHVGYNIGDCDFIFGPACVMDHWFCYVFDVNKMQFCALDSLVDTLTFMRLQRQQHEESAEEDRKGKRKKKRTSGQHIFKEKQWMANSCKCCFLKILRTLKPQVYGQDDQFEVNWPKLHLQTDTYSCGIIVLSWLKTWDGNTVDDKGYTMPKYSIEDLHQLRVDCLCWLINHPNNSQRERVLSILSDKDSRQKRK